MDARALPSSNVVRFPPRLRVVSGTMGGSHPEDAEPATAGVETLLPGNPATTALSVKPTVTFSPQRLRSLPKWKSSTSALNALLSSGTIDARQHAAGLAYGRLRRRYERSGDHLRSWRDASWMSDEAWRAVKREHARLLSLVGAERFVLDRLCLDGEAPMGCELERVVEALKRVAKTL